MDIDPGSATSQKEQRIPLTPSDNRTLMASTDSFENDRGNVDNHNQGIFQPSRINLDGQAADKVGRLASIPPQSDFAHISLYYLESIHEAYPILHWPKFAREVDQAYTTKDFADMSREWIGLYFAVLACGYLNYSQTDRSRHFYEIASQSVTPWPHEPTVAHTQILFLLSLYAAENDMRSAGAMWLACASRFAQLLALNREDTSLPPIEAELRRRLWWAIYVRDRYVKIHWF